MAIKGYRWEMLVTLTKVLATKMERNWLLGVVLSELANRFHNGKDDRKREISVSPTLRCEPFVKLGLPLLAHHVVEWPYRQSSQSISRVNSIMLKLDLRNEVCHRITTKVKNTYIYYGLVENAVKEQLLRNVCHFPYAVSQSTLPVNNLLSIFH